MVMTEPARRIAAARDMVVVVLASAAAYAIELALADVLPWGEEARGVLAVLAAAIAAVAITLGRGRPLADLGFRRPARWATAPLWILAILTVFIIAQGIVPIVLAPFFDLPAPDMSRYDAIRGDLRAAVTFAIALPLTASIPEEIVYRGFLMDRLGTLLGRGRGGTLLTVLTQALIFGSIHFQWGPGGIIMATVMGLVWGAGFVLCGRNLWIVILAHSSAHVLLVMQLYMTPPPG